MKNNEETVAHAMLVEWRRTGIISSEEIAYKTGDLYVAENVITKTRRIITPSVRESVINKRILKG